MDQVTCMHDLLIPGGQSLSTPLLLFFIFLSPPPSLPPCNLMGMPHLAAPPTPNHLPLSALGVVVPYSNSMSGPSLLGPGHWSQPCMRRGGEESGPLSFLEMDRGRGWEGDAATRAQNVEG